MDKDPEPADTQGKRGVMQDGFLDILGSGAVCKKTLRRGSGASPEFGQSVKVHFYGYILEDYQKCMESRGEGTSQGDFSAVPLDPAAQTFAEDERRCADTLYGSDEIARVVDEATWLVIGDQDVVPAIELAARLMAPGEICELNTDDRFAYGKKGRRHPTFIPPGSSLKLFVKALEVGRAPVLPAEADRQTQLEVAKEEKAAGNTFFASCKYESAIRRYKRGLQFVEGWEEEGPDGGEGQEQSEGQKSDVDTVHKEEHGQQPLTKEELWNERHEIVRSLLYNLSLCLFKQEKYRESLDACVKILEAEPENVKALFRASKNCFALGEVEQGKLALKKALDKEPNNLELRREWKTMKENEKRTKEKEKKMFGGRLGPTGDKEGHNDQVGAEKDKSLTATGTSLKVLGGENDANAEQTVAKLDTATKSRESKKSASAGRKQSSEGEVQRAKFVSALLSFVFRPSIVLALLMIALGFVLKYFNQPQ